MKLPDIKTLVAIKGTLISLGARCVGFLFIILATPKLLEYLGSRDYGVWCLVAQLVGFIGFADLGIGNGLLNKLLSIEDKSIENQYIVSAFYTLVSIAIFLIIFGILAKKYVHFFYSTDILSSEYIQATWFCLLIFALTLPFSIVQKIQLANLGSVRVHSFEVLEKLLSLLLTLYGIYLKLTLPLLFVFFYLPTFISQVFNLFTYQKLRYLKLIFKLNHFKINKCYEILQTGKKFFLLGIIFAITRSSDSYLIAMFSNIEAVSEYQLSGRVFEIASIIAYLPAWSLWSTIGNAIKNGDRQWIIRIQKRVVILVVGIVCLMIMPMLMKGNEILSFWLHQTIVYPSAIFKAYALYTIFNSIFTVLSTYLHVRSFIYQQCIMLFTFGILGIPLKLYFLNQQGLSSYIYANAFMFFICVLLPTLYLIKKDLYDSKIQ